MGDEPIFVNVASKEGDEDNMMELPCDEEGKLLLSTVQAQFPFAIGLKYRSSSGGWRGVKAENNIMDPPFGGWENNVYIITESDVLKRKATEGDAGGKRKTRKSSKLLDDLIVLGIPFSTSQEELYQYFSEKCGEVTFCDLKIDRETKKSRGFGFIRFGEEEGAQEALKGHHEIEGRRLEIRLSKKRDEVPMKLFIGKLLNGTTRDDVEDYFSDFGDLTDVFVPDGRGFAFVTFADQEDAQKVLRINHVLKGSRLHVTPAVPKEGVSPKRPENFGVVVDTKEGVRETSSSYGGYSSNSYSRQRVPQQQPPANNNNDLAAQLKDMLGQLINSQR